MRGHPMSTIPSRQSDHAALPAALELQNITLAFNDGPQRLPVLNDISLHVPSGQFISIVGPSGSGKSTLFHVIGGLLRPEQGQVRVNGQEITGKRGYISYVPQKPALFPWRTTLDNILLAREISGGVDQTARDDADKWIEKAGLKGFEDAYPHMLSGGMQQRASFLRGLIAPQELLCLDEPFSSLDELTRHEMQEWLLKLWEQQRRSVLLITHSIEEALLLSDTVYLFSNRPASIIHKIDVPFERPRRKEIINDPEFLRLKHEISNRMVEQQRQKPI